jgi:restriction system protein
MARRGFFAEIQRHSRARQREREREERQAACNAKKAMRAMERAKAEALRAANAARKSSAADAKRADKEARDAYLAQREAEVELLNSEVEQLAEDLASILSTTLSVDDFVDLTSLRTPIVHPPFERPDLEAPVPPPAKPALLPRPVLAKVKPPSGFFAFLGRRRYEKALERANALHAAAMTRWETAAKLSELRWQDELKSHADAETARVGELAKERERYQRECEARESEAVERNRKLDALITDLGYAVPDAIQEYVSIVLANSVYPATFPVNHEFEFDQDSAELRLKVRVPPPSSLSEAKAYKYSKQNDEITVSTMPQKERKERYAHAIHQVAIRSFHEVFEADRRGLIASIALEVGADATDPGTGRESWIPFVVAAAERNTFSKFDLSAVVPAATLERLGAEVSKNPYGLVPVQTLGVRRI